VVGHGAFHQHGQAAGVEFVVAVDNGDPAAASLVEGAVAGGGGAALCGWARRMTRGSPAAAWMTAPRLSSVEASSTTISSRSARVWARTERMAAGRWRAPL
jgi:hypothetical protein